MGRRAEPAERLCPMCEEPLPPPASTGRPRKFHVGACKAAADDGAAPGFVKRQREEIERLNRLARQSR